MKIQTPQFLQDLVRDLRDRRLLIPVGALLLGLVAVPLLLSRSASVPPAPPPASAESAPSAATQPAVLTEDVSVRDYKRRLEGLKSKNPFDEQFAPQASSGGGLEPAGGIAEPPAIGGGGGGDVGASTPTTTGSVSAGGSTTSTGSSAPSAPASEPKPKPPRIETRYFTRRIDVLVGPVGDTKKREGVRQLTLLPSKSKPVVAFLGIGESGDEAIFAVAGDVASVDTSGKCIPGSGDCAYLVLEQGDDAKFEYSPDGVTYRLVLKRISVVEIDKPGKIDGKL